MNHYCWMLMEIIENDILDVFDGQANVKMAIGIASFTMDVMFRS